MSRKVKNILESIAIIEQIQPKSENQSKLLESLQRNIFTFAVGNPGCGKSILCIWQAILELLNTKSKINKIVVIRPCIKNKFGEDLGALPGELKLKMTAHCMSIYDNLACFLDDVSIRKLFEHEYIEFTPLSLLRGRSLNNCFVIVEEAQNIKRSAKGIYMVMSRLGKDSKMCFNGDLKQSDLSNADSALAEALHLLRDPPLKNVGIVELYDYRDIQRNSILYSIMKRFGEDGFHSGDE